MASIGRLLSHIRASLASISPNSTSLSLPRSPISMRYGLPKMWLKNNEPVVQFDMTRLQSKFVMQRSFLRKSVRSTSKKGFIGISALAGGIMYFWPTDAYAMDGIDVLEEHHDMDVGGPSGFLKEDLYNFWALAKRFQLPAVLLVMVLLGWRHPITLVINIVLLLSCSRPSPYSVYIFIEQLRKHAMRQDPGLSKAKLFYARKVDVQDYKLLCTAKVELRDKKLSLIGILGSWWIFQSLNI